MAVPTLTLHPLPAVLMDQGAQDILSALTEAGEGARLIGGCVRDAVLGVLAQDIDIATTSLPEKTTKVLEAAGFKIKPVGIEHGVVLAVQDGRKYEVAILREDLKTDGRHAVVGFMRDWATDAWRRDFTINALSMDAKGGVYDYVDGLEDLKASRVRFIGDPQKRIAEDYLRILRYYRFHARIGGDWDMAARAACRANRAGLAQLSRERITDEIIKLLSVENPLLSAAAMTEDHIFVERLPTLVDVTALERLLLREKIYGAEAWPLRLAAWGGMSRYFFEEILLEPFGLPRAQHQLIKDYATIDLSVPLLHNLYHYGKAVVQGTVMLRAPDEGLPDLMTQIENFTPPKFPMQGEDLLAMGIAAGPKLGEILRATENWWLGGGCTVDAAACKNYAAKLATDSNA